MAEYLVEELSEEIQVKMDELAQKGNQLEKEGRLAEAVAAWQEGLELIPERSSFIAKQYGFWRPLATFIFSKANMRWRMNALTRPEAI